MKKHNDILMPAFYFVVGVIFIVIIQRYDVVKFLDSGFFIALVTFGVGLFAIYLYKKQQKDNKRDAARLVVQEIRYAEEQIRNARMLGENNFSLANKLLPTNSWHKNIHLFINDLLESQIDLISRFYSQSMYLDSVIGVISDEKNKMWSISEETLSPDGKRGVAVKATVLSSGYIVTKNNMAQLSANQILADVTNKIEFIYNSPSVDKLRSISEGKI